MRMAQWNPWKELERLQAEIGRAFAGAYAPFERADVYPPVNIWRNESGLILTAELPGLSPETLDITVNPDSVMIRAERKATKLSEGESWSRKERPDASFQRKLDLPVAVNPQSAEATYQKGVLVLKLQRPTEHRPTKVAVRGG